MTPREGFVALCLIMAKIDGKIHTNEITTIADILADYSFTEDEYFRVMGIFKDATDIEAFEITAEALSAASKLDDEMKDNLISILKIIARSDGKAHENETNLLNIVGRLLKDESTV